MGPDPLTRARRVHGPTPTHRASQVHGPPPRRSPPCQPNAWDPTPREPPEPMCPTHLHPLAPRAERRAPPAENDLAHGGGAAGAGAAGPAIGDQEVGVAAALAVDHAVVTEGGAFAVDRLGQDLADGAMQGEGTPGADAA